MISGKRRRTLLLLGMGCDAVVLVVLVVVIVVDVVAVVEFKVREDVECWLVSGEEVANEFRSNNGTKKWVQSCESLFAALFTMSGLITLDAQKVLLL